MDNLESEYKVIQERLDHEQSRIRQTNLDLDTKKQQIEQLKEELQYLGQKQQKQELQADPILTLKHELKKLGIADDSGKITKILSRESNI